MADIHPFYEAHRDAMVVAMRQRLDLAEPIVRERTQLPDLDKVRQEVLAEFEVVLSQIPYVGGAANRMSDFFTRLIGFMAIGRVLGRRGVSPPVIAGIESEIHQAHLLTVPEAERLASGRQFMSLQNQTLIREQAIKSQSEEYSGDFVYDFVDPLPGDTFEFGINYRSCGFCRFAARHGDEEILPHLCGLDSDAYGTRGIRLERMQTLAGGASHCNFRFSRQEPD